MGLDFDSKPERPAGAHDLPDIPGAMGPYETLAQKIARLLHALGPIPGAKLRELGVTGEPQESTECPIARYLRRFGIDATVTRGEVYAMGLEHCVPLPAPVREFVRDFDREGTA